jgi:hypothetical protein
VGSKAGWKGYVRGQIAEKVRVLKTDDSIRAGWGEYFHNVSSPNDDPGFDTAYQDHIAADVALFEILAGSDPPDAHPITEKEVAKAIKQLNKGKAPDKEGITAEHIQLASNQVVPCLTTLYNSILQSGHIPQAFKEGNITPILKKGKSKIQPSNYRGITINSIIGKVLEVVCLQRMLPTMRAHQSALQRGFTQKVSAMNAALLLMETVSEYRDSERNLTTIFLDVEKAFDVVWIDGLLHKLHRLNIPRQLWSVLADWYRGMSASVKWKGTTSQPFRMAKGLAKDAPSHQSSLSASLLSHWRSLRGVIWELQLVT